MPKKKKTRDQKILADHRRETIPTSVYSLNPNLITASKQPTPTIKSNVTIATKSYGYLAHDLRKTTFFTFSILLIELLLKNFIK